MNTVVKFEKRSWENIKVYSGGEVFTDTQLFVKVNFL